MTVAKAFVRGVMIAGCLGASARGGPMLVLGTFSDQVTSLASAAGDARTFSAVDPNPAPQWLGSPTAPPAPASPAPPAYVPPAQPAFTPPPAYSPPQAPASPPPTSTVYDAFINLGTSAYADAGSLTTGNAQPWYANRSVDALFGAFPNAQQRDAFNATVLQRVGQSFRQSGISINLTNDPNATAAHTLSVVSNTANPTSGQVIGMTYLGGNGFHYIDQSVKSARSLDQLEWIVAHNVSHELMLAFGVPEVHDASGNFIDARNASWQMMVSPNARFSTDATSDLLSRNFGLIDSSPLLMGAQVLETQPVPEPATLALWALGSVALLVARKRA